MNIFVSGGTGFIGNRLVWRLIEEGHTVHALCRSPEKADNLEHPSIRVFQGNITEPDKVREAMYSCTQVYHLAAYARVASPDEQVYYNINVEGTRNLLECAKQKGIERFVFTSSAGVMGPSTGKPAREEDPPPGSFFNLYETTKYEAEQVVKEYAGDRLRTVIVNPSRVYGPGLLTPSNAVTKLILWYVKGKWHWLPGSGRRKGNYVLVDDVVEGHLLAMEKGQNGAKYLLGGENISYREFFAILKKVFGINSWLMPVPMSVLMVIVYGITGWAKLTGSSPLITPAWLKKYLHDWEVSSGKAREELGYKPVSFEKGADYTIRWLKDKALL